MATEDEINEIKSRLDVVDVVSDYVKLEKRGRNYWGLCPFHSEKTPSFSVAPEKQMFYCFGCHKGGGIFNFIMEAERLEFPEAVAKLAERAGVSLSSSKRGGDRGQTRDINAAARDFFIKSLSSPGGEQARRYLERRRLSPADCARFEIGWAPDAWDALLRALRASGFDDAQTERSGFAKRSEKSGGLYDRFRARVMFPIRNIAGRVIGFGGRDISGAEPKYLNSPESALFNKRHNLYLLDKAKSAINSKGCAILTEGYLDAVRCHISGYTNAVASLGTAFTEEQARLLKRLTGMCFVCYDADAPGEEAALRAMYILQKEGVAARRVRLSGGKDPDEILLLPGGKEIFDSALSNAAPLPIFHATLRSEKLKDPATAAEARRDLTDGLASLSPFDVAPYIGRLSALLNVFPHEAQNMIDEARRNLRKIGEKERFGGLAFREKEEPEDVEYMLCALLWEKKELRRKIGAQDAAKFIENKGVQSIIISLLMGEDTETLERRWRRAGDSCGMSIIARGRTLLSNRGIGLDMADKLTETLKRRYLKKRVGALVAKVKDRTITEEEYEEYLRYTKELRGGSVKA